MKRGVVTFVVAAVALVPLTGGVAADTASVPFKVEQARLNLGDIRAGTEAVATFVFHNDGQEDVKILRAKPS